MTWTLDEALDYYRKLGAPQDQSALISLLKEIQQEYNGIPKGLLSQIADHYQIREALLLALIRRIPSLRLADTHLLELCCGPSCSKTMALRDFLETTALPQTVTVKYVPCMRQCGKGPNLRWDGRLYNKADLPLLRRLLNI